jgi:hypothetical protein
MLIDAILQKILHLPPEYIFRGILFLIAIVGIIASLAPAVFFQLLELTPGAKKRRRRELNADLQRKYEGVCAELVEKSKAFELLAQDNTRLVGLLREEHSHNRDWDIRARRELDERKAAGA